MAFSWLFGFGRRKPTPGVRRGNPDIIGSTKDDAIGLGRICDWKTGKIGGRMRYRNRGEGVILVGRNGSGKDVRVIINQLLASTGFSSSYFILDVKGELAAVCAPYLRTIMPVYIINPFGMLVEGETHVPGYEDMASIGFNALRALNPKKRSFISDCSYVASAIVTGDTSGGGNAAHFINSARNLIKLCIIIEVRTAAAQNRVPTMANVRAMICMPSGADYGTKLEYGWPVKAKELIASGDYHVRNLASQFTAWNNEISGILSEAKQQTESFDVTEIAEDMAKPGFDMEDLKRGRCAVFVCMDPLEMGEHYRYLRLLVDTALRAVMRPRKKGEPRCTFILNEFATLGRLESLRRTWAVVRGYGITLMPCLQSFNQLTETYGKENTATFLGQAGIIASFGAADMETAEWLSKRCGDKTAILPGYNQGTQNNGNGLGLSSGLNWSLTKVPAVTPFDMLDLSNGRMVIFAAGLGNFISGYGVPYYQIDQASKRARANPFYNPEDDA